ncbi:MAG: hypothetical protein ABFS05_05430, partial [Bacteroidota bacterium]
MKTKSLKILSLTIILLCFLASCKFQGEDDSMIKLPTNASRTWIGPEYWANPLQDWRLHNGEIECISSGGYRSVFLLTHEIGTQEGGFSMSVNAKNLNPAGDTLNEGWIGFEIGIHGEFDDYRSRAIRGRGLPIGLSTEGSLFIGEIDSGGISIPNITADHIFMKIDAVQQDDSNYTLSLEVKSSSSPLSAQSQAQQYSITRNNIPASRIEGGIALMCHSGLHKQFWDETKPVDYQGWGTSRGTQRNGNVNFGFADWKISGDKINVHENRMFGPILFAQYTLSEGILKMTAQLPPIGKEDSPTVDLQIDAGAGWKTISKAGIDSLSRTATFIVVDWDASEDIPYRLAYELYSEGNKLKEHYFEGCIRHDPTDKKEIVVAGFTGNNDMGFPNNDIVNSVKYHDPDLLFFSGDQIYEGVGDYGAQRAPLDKACLDYLRKWYLYGWAYADLMRDRPTIAIPDDHDVYHGNIWGAGGIATPAGLVGGKAQDEGGYKMPAAWVNMVQRTQTSHLPDPYNPTAVAQDIGVYYTDMKYGGISFAILEDRKFKS